MEASLRTATAHRSVSGFHASTSGHLILPCKCNRPAWHPAKHFAGEVRLRTLTRGASDAGGSGTNPNDESPQAIALVRRLPGPEVTFVLAGFLKILTIGGLAYSAPVDAVRTVAGKMSPYMMVPVGLVMCWVAKVITDNELQESKRFMAMLVAFLVLLYFGLYRLLYRYDPDAYVRSSNRTAQQGTRVSQLRSHMGDRDLLDVDGAGGASQRYEDERRKINSYEAPVSENPYWQRSNRVAADGSTATLDARNPARAYQRRGGAGAA